MPMRRLVHRQPAQALASFAVAGVALITIVLALGNVALWLYAQNTVVAAAQEAAVVASRENGTPLQTNNTYIRQVSVGSDLQSLRAGSFTARVFALTEIYNQDFSSIAADR